MTTEEFNNLQEGDIIQNLGSGLGYTIVRTTQYGKSNVQHIVMRTITAANPSEWRLMYRLQPVEEIEL